MGEGKVTQKDVSDQDVFGLLTESSKKLRNDIDKTQKSLDELAKTFSKVSKNADLKSQKGINEVIKANNAATKAKKKQSEADKILVKDAKLLNKTMKEQAAEQKRVTAETNRKVKASIKARKSTIAEADSNKRLNVQLRNARNRLKRLTIEYGKNNVKTIQATRNYDRLERKQRELNKTTKRGTRSLKLFGLQFNTVRGSALRMAAGLGLVGGGFAIFRNAFNTVKDFEQGQADLASVLGTNVKGMKALTDQAKELGATTTFTATEVSSLQKSFAKLGFTQSEIEGVTEATLLLAEATGTELGEAATVTGSTLRAFGLTSKDTQRVVDVMAKSFSASSLDMQKFKVAMATVAPVAKAMGLSIEETTALIGTLTDNGVEASTAGAGLRNMMLDAKNAGLTLDEALEKINNSTDKVGTSFELFGKRGATLGVILSENREATDKLTGSLEKSDDAAKDMAETQRKTLGGALKLLSSAWDGYILKTNEATGASGGLKDMVVFLSENLETIVNTLMTVVKWYGFYRLALIGLKLSKHIGELRTYNKGLKQSGVETAKLSKGAGKLKGALKGIGWAAAIAAVTAWAQAIFSAVTEAGRLEKTLDAISKKTEEGSKLTADRAEDRAKNLADRLEEIALSTEFKTEKARAEAHSQALKSNDDLIRADIKLGQSRQKTAEKNLAIIQAQADAHDGFLTKSAEAAEALLGGFGVSEAQQTLIDIQNELSKAKGVVEGTRTEVRAFKEELNGSSISITTNTRELSANTAAQGDSNEELEEKVSLLREIEDEQIKQIKNEQDLAIIQAGTDARRQIEDIDVNATAQQRADLTIEIEKNLLLELTRIDKEFFDQAAEIAKQAEEEARQAREAANIKRLAEEKEFRDNLLKAKKLQLLRSGKEEDEINKEFLEAEIELLQLRTSLTLDEQISLEEKKRQLKKLELAEEKAHQDELLALRKKVFDQIDKFAQKALDKQIENSQKKQELLDKEISNSQTLEDRLRESAANGNAIASESLAAQSDITEEKQREKIKEAKRQERIEELKALWQTLNTFLNQGDNPLVAGGKAIGVVAGFKSLFSGIAGFFKGTKGRLKDEHKAQMSGRDGHVVRVDGDEAILTGDKMDRLAAAGLTSTNDIVNSAIMNQQLVGVPMANPIDDRVIMTANNAAMESTLAEILNATKNNAPFRLTTLQKRGLVFAMRESQTKNGNTDNNWTYL